MKYLHKSKSVVLDDVQTDLDPTEDNSNETNNS